MIEDFQLAVEGLDIDVNNYTEMKKYFKRVLGHGPAEKFRKLIQHTLYVNTVHQNVISEYAFEKLMKAFLKLYCTSTDPKGDVIEYLKSDKCKKPKDKSVSDHQDRIEEMMRYCTYLEGARNNLSENEMKTILFMSFPIAWQMSYKRSQPPIQTAMVETIMVFMSQEKEFSDHNNNKPSRWQDRGGDGGGQG